MSEAAPRPYRAPAIPRCLKDDRAPADRRAVIEVDEMRTAVIGGMAGSAFGPAVRVDKEVQSLSPMMWSSPIM